MVWLSQNWVWLVLIVGFFLLVSRRGGMAGCGMGGYRRQRGESSSPPAGNGGTTPYDPVSRHAVAAGSAISSIYHGRAYYFESREDREAFEADPEKHLAAAGEVGSPIDPGEAEHHHQNRHHGC